MNILAKLTTSGKLFCNSAIEVALSLRAIIQTKSREAVLRRKRGNSLPHANFEVFILNRGSKEIYSIDVSID
jgi:hypothetical protein